MVRRIFDILLSFLGIIFVLPLFPIIGLMIKIDTRGPVFYLADRVGKDMKLFKMLKFRTMIDTQVQVGECVCPQGDVRVTAVGKFLRRSKLNELPQLLNILKGDMTFVGPRPEAPELVSLYPDNVGQIFSVRPGLVGPNDLAYFSGDVSGRNEEELYPPGVDPKKFYAEEILPQKLKIDLEHIENRSMLSYFKFILLGIWETFIGSINKKHIQQNRIQISLVAIDVVLSILTFSLACGLYFQFIPRKDNLSNLVLFSIVVVVVRKFFNILFGIYNSLLEFFSKHDFLRILKAISTGTVIIFLSGLATDIGYYPVAVALIDSVVLLSLLSLFRVTLKFFLCKEIPKPKNAQTHNALIYGASDAGISAYKALMAEKNGHLNVVGFIDDAPEKCGKTLCCLKVLGNQYHIKDLAKLHQIEEIILAMPEISATELSRIIEVCKEANLNYRLFSSINDMQNIKNCSFPFRTLDIADLLGHKKQILDQRVVKEGMADKIILVNGSGGALGLEICRRTLQAGCQKLIITDRYESYLTELVTELYHEFSNDFILPILLDMDKDDALEAVFENYRPEVVFHTCMKKYITFCNTEFNHVAATNYVRTFKLARLAQQFKCETFILISSIDAGAATSFINASLRIAEISLEHFFSDSHTRLIITKYGNIIENRGGIVAAIDDQIRTRKAVTLPDAEALTYLISKDTAVNLINESLKKAPNQSSNNSIYIVEKGVALSFVEIAKRLSNFYGLNLGTDVSIEYLDSCQLQQNSLSGYIHKNESAVLRKEKDDAKNYNLSSHELRYVFKNFVNASNSNFTTQDWINKTQELVGLCGQSLLPSES